jgi:hypothetical protein
MTRFDVRTKAMRHAALLLALLACQESPGSAGPDTPDGDDANAHPRITLNGSVRFQTIVGWEGVAQAGQADISFFPTYRDAVYDKLVNELGINRLRLEMRANTENPQDYFFRWQQGQITVQEWNCRRYETVNDNADVNIINAAGFKFSELDNAIEQVVIPIRQRLQARGEALYLNLNYVAFNNIGGACGGGPYVHANPAEYAELMLATFQHMQARFGFVPNSVEIILEPDNTPYWTGTLIGQAIVATGARLAAAGFHPEFIGPGTTNMTTAIGFFGAMVRVPGVLTYLKEISYHRYAGVSNASLSAIADSAVKYNLRTAMLERIGADANDLHADLEVGRNSAWEQYVLAWSTQVSDNGAQYYRVDPAARILTGQRTPALQQYFRYIRAGAVRIGAASDATQFRPLAFRHQNGKHTVVVNATAGGTFYIEGLPAATYGVTYTTSSELNVAAPDVVLAAGRLLRADIPNAGVITVFAR